MQTFFKANEIKGNENPFDIAGVRYMPCSISPSLTVYSHFNLISFSLTSFARSGECKRDLTLGKDSRSTDELSPREAGGPIKPQFSMVDSRECITCP